MGCEALGSAEREDWLLLLNGMTSMIGDLRQDVSVRATVTARILLPADEVQEPVTMGCTVPSVDLGAENLQFVKVMCVGLRNAFTNRAGIFF